MQFTAKEVSLLLNGVIEGDPDVAISSLAKIEDAQKGTLSFVSNPKYQHFLYTTQASVVIVNKDLVIDKPLAVTIIKVDNAYSAFSIFLEKYNTLKFNKQGIESPSFIHPDAVIGKDVYIGAFVYIGANAVIEDNAKIYPHCFVGDNASVGQDSILFSGVKIYHDCIIGKNNILHAGVIIGADGFGFAPQPNGTYAKISQIGNVITQENVEIGANTCIDRATMGSTIIFSGVKLDNLIQVAHNVEIGKNTVIASQTGISGSAKIGDNCIIAGQVGVVGHISLAKGSQVQAKSGVNRSIEQEGKKWGGVPIIPYQDHLRSQVVVNRLPELEKKVFELEKIINQIKSQFSI